MHESITTARRVARLVGRRSLMATALLALVGVGVGPLGCSGSDSDPISGTGTGDGRTLIGREAFLSPDEATIEVGSSYAFSAELVTTSRDAMGKVWESGDHDVTLFDWVVLEADGGWVGPDGTSGMRNRYNAPDTPGEYHLRIVALVDETVTDTSTITVVAGTGTGTGTGGTCPVDENGSPDFDCNDDNDCVACSPSNQVCDGSPPRCVDCSPTNTQHCFQSEVCLDSHCIPKCPSSCSTDTDCTYCGSPGHEAHVCFEGHCSQCNTTDVPCSNGRACVHGACVFPCGTAASPSGDCLLEQDCYYCGGEAAFGTWDCIKEGGTDPSDHGVCGPPAAGCADLGSGATILPEPWAAESTAGSSDDHCDDLGVAYEVGDLIRELIGADELDIGVDVLALCDITSTTNLSRCATIEITDSVSCGACVPCLSDADCLPIALDPLVQGLFCDDPLAAIGGAFLFDMLGADEGSAALHFFCEPVGACYGICTPCAWPMLSCTPG